ETVAVVVMPGCAGRSDLRGDLADVVRERWPPPHGPTEIRADFRGWIFAVNIETHWRSPRLTMLTQNEFFRGFAHVLGQSRTLRFSVILMRDAMAASPK